MTDVIGRGVIEVSADSSKLKAGVDDAKKSIKSLGKSSQDESTKSSQSIDRYIKKLQQQVAVQGKSAREAKLYELAVRGASRAQLDAANTSLRLVEAFERGQRVGGLLRAGLIATATAAGAAAAGLAALGLSQTNAVDAFNDLKDATGASIENISALDAVNRRAGGSFELVEASLLKLNQALNSAEPGSDVERNLRAIGLSVQDLKKLDPAEAFRTVAVALQGYANDGDRARIVQELFGKSTKEIAPFLKDLAESGKLVATTTTEQAEAAEKFNKQLFELRAGVTDLARSLLGDLIPALSQTIASFNKLGGFKGVIADLFGTNEQGRLESQATALQAQITRTGDSIARMSEELNRSPANDFLATRIDKARERMQLLMAEAGKVSERLKGVAQDLAPLADPSAAEDARLGRASKPTVKVPAKVDTKGANEAAQRARARLQFDLEQIRNASDEVVNTLRNSEQIMEAVRAAGLLDEREYYDSKLGFLRLNSDAQARALELEIARLRQEKLAGKDRIDNERQIAEAQSKLKQIREDSAAGIQVLSIQESAALKQIEQSWRDAEAAAQDYLDGIRRGNARELAGMGAGTQERSRLSGRAQIEDNFSQQRRDLERSRRDAELTGTFGPQAQRKYDEELDRIRRFQAASLAEFDKGYAAILESQGKWSTGASEAYANYIAETQNVASQTEALFSNAFRGLENALVDFVTTGKLDFQGFANSIVADITRIIIKQQIANALMAAMGPPGPTSSMSAGGGGIVQSFLGSLLGGGRAIGGPVSAGGIYPVNEKGPELLQMAGRQYLMMGNQGGEVKPASGGGSAPRPVQITNHFHVGNNVDRRSQAQIASASGRAVQRVLARDE